MVKRLKEISNKSHPTSDIHLIKSKSRSTETDNILQRKSTSIHKSKPANRKLLIKCIKSFALKAVDSELKYDIIEVLKYLRGEEMDEIKEVKKIAEEAFNESEMLLERNAALLAELNLYRNKK